MLACSQALLPEVQQGFDLGGIHHRFFTFSDLDTYITQLVANAFEHIERHDGFAVVGLRVTDQSTEHHASLALGKITDRFRVFVQLGFVKRPIPTARWRVAPQPIVEGGRLGRNSRNEPIALWHEGPR